MAELQLNFDENNLDPGVYDLYTRLYEGMKTANQCELPDYMNNPPLTETGEIDVAAINTGLAQQNEVQIKNMAYMMASAIISSVGDMDDEDPEENNYLLRTGDSMTGLLSALKGFKAGYDSALIFETTIDSNKNVAHVYGQLDVNNDAVVKGGLHLSDSGLYFANAQTIFYKDQALHINSANIKVAGNMDIVGQLSVGNITISKNGIFNNEAEYYHSGNSNNADTNWDMCDAYVYGDFAVDGQSVLYGKLIALNGFSLGEGDTEWLYSHQDQSTSVAYIALSVDLALSANKGIVYDGSHIIMAGSESVSISAPNKVMRLGDAEGETVTKYIALQTSIKNHSGDYDIVTQYGDGNFKNSFSAGCGNAVSAVMATYFTSLNDCGVVFHKNVRLGSNSGPTIKSDNAADIVFVMPYKHSDVTEQIPFYISYQDTTSLLKNQSKEWSASLIYDTDAEFFTFKKPVESESFSIISTKYTTRLTENTLFFDDSVFIEGLSGGIRISNNAYFDNNLSSMQFSSGFAGSGWAIMRSELVGGFTATFDELTVRKKMRVYEQEVQKYSITNGSLWVSDACSGDLVEEIV